MTTVTKVVDSLYNSTVGKMIANPRATAATATAIATVSNVSKDALNCWYYTEQSRHNKKIPEKQRNFVAALDLSNGLLNVALQVIMAFGITDMITAIFDDKLAKTKPFSTDEKVIAEKFGKLSEELKGKMNLEEFAKHYKTMIEKNKKLARLGFSVLTANIAMQILTKRIFTPLIATPLASFFKKYFEKSDEKNTQKADENKPAEKA